MTGESKLHHILRSLMIYFGYEEVVADCTVIRELILNEAVLMNVLVSLDIH